MLGGFLSRTMEMYYHKAEESRLEAVKTFQGLT